MILLRKRKSNRTIADAKNASMLLENPNSAKAQATGLGSVPGAVVATVAAIVAVAGIN